MPNSKVPGLAKHLVRVQYVPASCSLHTATTEKAPSPTITVLPNAALVVRFDAFIDILGSGCSWVKPRLVLLGSIGWHRSLTSHVSCISILQHVIINMVMENSVMTFQVTPPRSSATRKNLQENQSSIWKILSQLPFWLWYPCSHPSAEERSSCCMSSSSTH